MSLQKKLAFSGREVYTFDSEMRTAFNSSITSFSFEAEVGNLDLERISVMIEECQKLLGNYVSLEDSFLSQSIKKAIALDSIADSSSLVSSVIDDISFVLHKCSMRSFASADVSTVCAVLNISCRLLQKLLISSFESKYNLLASSGFPAKPTDIAYNVNLVHALWFTSIDLDSFE